MSSTTANLPKSLSLVIQRQQPIARIVTLAALRAPQEAANMHPAPIIALGNRKARAATAGNQKHAKVFRRFILHQFPFPPQ
jgi:hypothetical protein